MERPDLGVVRPRWAHYFASLDEALVRKAAPRQIDWHAFEAEWAGRTTRHPDRPSGDPYRLAEQVAAALPPPAATR